MRKFGKYAGTSLLAGGLLLGGLGLIPGDVAKSSLKAAGEAEAERHPHIHHAIRELREAKKEIQEADHDFKGHRKEAVEAVDHAIRQLERCLEADRR